VETINIFRWSLEVDPQTTRAAHALLNRGGAEECGCDPCRNFIAARDQVFTAEFILLLRALGVDPRREVEVYHNARLPSGLHCYGGWFHAVGKIAAGGECWREVKPRIRIPELESLSPQLAIGFQLECALVREPFRGLSLIQVEFQAEVPWVISAPEPQ
jgi:hypothetical protein